MSAQTPQNIDAQEARIKELTEENELLFDQLHVVQEELEKYYHKLKECEQRKGSADVGTIVSVSPKAAEALAENRKLRALVEQQKIALRVETQNSLASRLGQMLITGVGSTGSLFALPGKLRKMWKALDRTVPPAELGGKTFQKVLDTHDSGGPEAVEKLLDSVFISPVMRANAYTALARHLMLTDVQKAAANARLAWETDPKPYRLKWLAFRVHDADDAVTAEALLDMLPGDISMSESEERQAMRIRHESKRERTEKARRESGDAAADSKKAEELGKQAAGHKREVEWLTQQMVELQKAADQHKREAEQARAQQSTLQKQLDATKTEADTLEAELGTAREQYEDLASLLNKSKDEINILQAKNLELQSLVDGYEEEIITLKSNLNEAQTLFEALQGEMENLNGQLCSAQQESTAFRTALDDLKIQSEEQKRESWALQAQRAELQALADSRKAEADSLRANMASLEKLAAECREEVARTNKRYDELLKIYQEDIKLVTAQQKDTLAAMAAHDAALTNGFEKQGSELERVHKSIQSSCKQEIDKALQQTVAYGGLSSYFASGEIPAVTPWKRGWPASPDFVLWMVELIDKNDYDLIVEFGSGVTTLYSAKALAAREMKNSSAKKIIAVTFEHLEQFFLQTRSLLDQSGVGERINVVHAPLHEYTAPDGTVYQYYSCENSLSELSSRYKSGASRILVIVDGPPGATNKNARYPAFPIVMKHFAPAHIDFLLDDYLRGDEKELAGLWKAACATAGLQYSIVEKQLEKEALLLSIAPMYAG